MTKRSGSRSSRSERRAERERAERAREHGLPERQAVPMRARAATPEPDDLDREPQASGQAPPLSSRRAGIPTLAKVVGAAIVILLGVYLLSRQRDKALNDASAAPEPPTASPSSR